MAVWLLWQYQAQQVGHRDALPFKFARNVDAEKKARQKIMTGF